MAQTLPPNPFGINFWMPEKYLNNTSQPAGACSYTNMQRMVDNLSASIVRIGGIGYDVNGTAISTASTTNDYIRAVQQVKYNNNSTPRFIIQIPYASGSYGFSLANVATLVGNLTSYFPGDVFYYSIGNEWNNYSSTEKTVANVASKFKSYAQKIKETDANAIVLSPNMTDVYATDATVAKNYYQDLFDPSSGNYIGGFISGGTANGLPYCDIIDIHMYPGNLGSGFSNGATTPITQAQYDCWRDNSGCTGYVVGMNVHPQNNFKSELSTGTYGGSYNGMQALINNCSPSRGTSSSYPLKIAVTEFNITTKNPYLSSQSATSDKENTFAGIGARSFFAGQWMMECFCTFLTSCGDKAAFMLPWSIHESGGDGMYTTPGYGEDLSLTRGTANNSTDPTPVPTYHHYEMLADNFRNCTNVLQATTSNANIKCYGAYNTLTGTNSKFVVVIMNQTSTAYTTRIQLDNTSQSGDYAIMNFPSAPNTGYTYSLGANSTALFVFNSGGEMLRKTEYKLSQGSTGVPTNSFYRPVSNNWAVMSEIGADVSTCCGAGTAMLYSDPTIAGASYAWYSSSNNFTGSPIAITPNLWLPTGNYVYKCVVTLNGQTAWDYARGNVSNICCKLTGMNEVSDSTESFFYAMPNPTDDKTIIKYTLPENVRSAKIDLTDISGKHIKSVSVTNENTSVDLDCKELSNGIYFYSLNVNGTIIKAKKLVITK
jgi:hypothetical protein